MKSLKFVLIILTLLKLNMSAGVLTEGKLVFLYYVNNQLTKSDVSTFEFLPSDTCKSFGDNLGLKLSSWDRSTQNLGLELYPTKDCTGTATQKPTLQCDLSKTITGAPLGTKSLSCYFTDFDAEGKFEISAYSDATCKTSTNNNLEFSKDQNCWKIDYVSLIPQSYNEDTNEFYTVVFPMSTTCDVKTLSMVVGSVCDSSVCRQGAPGSSTIPYFTCNYNSSAFLIVNLMLTFALLLFLF